MNTPDLLSRRFNTLTKLAEKQDTIVLSNLVTIYADGTIKITAQTTIATQPFRLFLTGSLNNWLIVLKIQKFDIA